jgi:small-conductance mechanosensitive channel
VPNEMLITQRVENSSLADQKVSINSVVQVAYGTDVRALRPKIEAAIRQVPRVIKEPSPAMQLNDFADNGMNLGISFWIADPENGTGNVRSDVNLAVLDLLNAEGVEIPYPQQVTHVRPGADAAAQAAQAQPASSAEASGAQPEGATAQGVGAASQTKAPAAQADRPAAQSASVPGASVSGDHAAPASAADKPAN